VVKKKRQDFSAHGFASGQLAVSTAIRKQYAVLENKRI